jgi:hypothetical protein
MDLNKLPYIKWIGLTIFQEAKGNLVVLECKTHEQATDFFELLSTYDFSFSIDRSNSEYPKLTITVLSAGYKVSIKLEKDILSKYFATRNINLLTTGFDMNGGLACLDDRLEIEELHTFNLN